MRQEKGGLGWGCVYVCKRLQVGKGEYKLAIPRTVAVVLLGEGTSSTGEWNSAYLGTYSDASKELCFS